MAPLLMGTVVATGAVVSFNAAPAGALSLSNSNQQVDAFKANDWVYLINPGATGSTNPILGNIILQSLTTSSATFRIRIDNNLNSPITGFSFTMANVGGNLSVGSFSDPLTTDTDFFGSPSISKNSNDWTLTFGAANSSSIPNLGLKQFDDFIVNVSRNGSSFDTTNGISINTLQFQTTGGTVSGTFSTVPTPALIPGLIGLGLGVWRKRKQEEVSEEV